MNSVALYDCGVGSRIWFEEEKRPYTVRTRSYRYLVCTKPFNLKRTTLYTIVDLGNGMRGTENLVFGMGAETQGDCRAMLGRLHDRDYPSAVSRRNQIPVRVTRIEPGRGKKIKKENHEHTDNRG